MQIRCRACGKSIPADDVHLDSGLAKCRGCHAVFEFAAQVKERPATPRAPGMWQQENSRRDSHVSNNRLGVRAGVGLRAGDEAVDDMRIEILTLIRQVSRLAVGSKPCEGAICNRLRSDRAWPQSWR